MKQTFQIPVIYRVKAASKEQAEEFVERLQRYGFEPLSEYERPTWKAIERWQFAEIRGRK